MDLGCAAVHDRDAESRGGAVQRARAPELRAIAGGDQHLDGGGLEIHLRKRDPELRRPVRRGRLTIGILQLEREVR